MESKREKEKGEKKPTPAADGIYHIKICVDESK